MINVETNAFISTKLLKSIWWKNCLEGVLIGKQMLKRVDPNITKVFRRVFVGRCPFCENRSLINPIWKHLGCKYNSFDVREC